MIDPQKILEKKISDAAKNKITGQKKKDMRIFSID